MMFNNRAEAKQRFSLRKLTVGVVSVLLGLTFLTYNGENVHADTNTPSAQAKSEEVNSNSSSTVAEKATIKTNSNKQENVADQVQNKLTSSSSNVEKANQQQGQVAKSQNTGASNPAKAAGNESNQQQTAGNKQTNSGSAYTLQQVEDAFEINRPDLSDAQLKALNLDRDTYLYHGVKYRYTGTFDLTLENGQVFTHVPFHVTHNPDGTFHNLYYDEGEMGAHALNMGISPKVLGFNYAYGPVLEGTDIYVNKGTKQLSEADALRALPKKYQAGYKKAAWNLDPKVTNVDLNKADTYHAVIEVTYKNDLGVSTGIKVHVVDLKGHTITGIIGKDIDTKMKDVDARPDKYIDGAPANSQSFIWRHFPDTTKVTAPGKPAKGVVRVTYPDGNCGDVAIYVNVTDPTTVKDISVPVTRTVHFGYWNGSHDNLANWHQLEPDVKQSITLKYKVEVNSRGEIVKYIGWEPGQNGTLSHVDWIKINGWHPDNNQVDNEQSTKYYAAADVTPIDLSKNNYVAGYSYNCYAAYDKDTYSVRAIDSQKVIRRIHFIDVNHKKGYINPPVYQYLTFYHNIKVDQDGKEVADLGWQAYNGQGLATFAAVPWKDLSQDNWYKYNVDVKNAANAYTVLAGDVAKNPAKTQYIDAYAEYVSPHLEKLTARRIVHFGHYLNKAPHDGSKGTFDKNHNPVDWRDLINPVTQQIEVDAYEYTTSDGITHFIKYLSNNPVFFDPVNWKFIKDWYHVSADKYAAPSQKFQSNQFDLNGHPEAIDIIYREYARDIPEDKVIETKYILRRVYFGYYGDGTSVNTAKEWHNLLSDPVTQLLVFYHHQVKFHDLRNGATKYYWQAYDGKTLQPVAWKTIAGWTKGKNTQYAADSYTVKDEAKEIGDASQDQLIHMVYAPYIKVSQPTSPVQPTKPTSPTQPTNQPSQPTSQPSQPTTIPPKPPVNPSTPSTAPAKPTKPVQPTNNPAKPVKPAQPTTVKPKPVNPAKPTAKPGKAGKSNTVKPISENGNSGRHNAGTVAPKATSSKSYSGLSNAAAPKANNNVLPQTGTKNNDVCAAIGVAIAAVASFFGLAGTRRRKRF